MISLSDVALTWVAIALAAGCAGTSAHSEAQALRVGTTGDFPPYSFLTSSGYEGIDITLAEDLGQTLGRRVEFVETDWSSLLLDLVHDRFDVAMSGINVTGIRSRAADFSIPYSEDIRVAVVRCSEQERFARLADMDSPDVTVFVRYGGTSAPLALRHFSQARVEQVHDWDATFDRLTSGNGDVILAPTDYEVRRRPELCTGLGGAEFWPKPIAVLLPKNSPLKPQINEWLERRLRDGSLGRVLERHGIR